MSHQDKKNTHIQVWLNSELSTIDSVPVRISSRFDQNTDTQTIGNGLHKIEQHLSLGRFDQLQIHIGDLRNLWVIHNRVQIKGIIADGIDLNPHDIHLGRQYPDHTLFDHQNPVEYYEPGTHFDYPGLYTLDIEMPIWRWALYAFAKLTPYRKSLYESNRDKS